MTDIESLEYYSRSIRLSKSRVEELLDAVERERNCLKMYQSSLEELNRKILEKQIREEVEREYKTK